MRLNMMMPLCFLIWLICTPIQHVQSQTSQSQTSQSQTPQSRIMSLNVCADQLLMDLAHDKIHSLSPLSRDANYSYSAQNALSFAQNTGRGEEVLLERPSHVFVGKYDGKARLHLLARANLNVILIEPWETLEHGFAILHMLGTKLDAQHKAQARIDDIKSALNASHNIAHTHKIDARKRVAVLQRRGYTSGRESLMGELIIHMGLEPYVPRNVAGEPLSKLNPKLGGFLRLEHLIMDPPDYVILSKEDQIAIDQGSAFLAHQALKAALPAHKRIIIPTLLSACEGVATPALIRTLADQIRQKTTH